MNNTIKQDSRIKTGFVLLFVSLILLIIKEVLFVVMVKGMEPRMLTTLAYIGSGLLILVSIIKNRQKKNNLFSIIAFTFLICLYIYYEIDTITGGYSNWLRWVIEYGVYLTAYVVALITAITKPERATIAGVCLIIVALLSTFESIISIADTIKWSYNAFDTIYFIVVSFACSLFDISLAVIIPKIIIRPKTKKVESRNEFEKISLILQSLKSEYEKGNISQEYYDTKRAELLKKL